MEDRMNIALIGYGKMGKIIEARALERGHWISAVVEPFAGEKVSASGAAVSPSLADIPGSAFARTDVALDFTAPAIAPLTIRALAERGIPLVVGTTGWYGELPEITDMVNAAGASLLWASNFSLGVNLFYRIASYAANLMDPFEDYDVGGFEGHHNGKADSPSGTAKTLTGRVLAVMSRKKRTVFETLDRPPAPEELHYPSLRLGSMPGTHSLIFDSPADSVEIIHTARSREGFAAGAVLSAEWLVSCPGPGMTAGEIRRGVFTIDDVLGDILG
jgi:4-hydroxy-tetrahydrodipicolinate reductase